MENSEEPKKEPWEYLKDAKFNFFEGHEIIKIKELGKGGQGAVYLIESNNPEGESLLDDMETKQFALKLLVRNSEQDKFIRKEIKKSMTFHHPHFVKIFEAENKEVLSMIAMEVAEGTLEDKIRQQG